MMQDIVALARYEAALRLIARLDSYRLLKMIGRAAHGDEESVMRVHDEYSALSGLDIRAFRGHYGNVNLDRLRRNVGLL